MVLILVIETVFFVVFPVIIALLAITQTAAYEYGLFGFYVISPIYRFLDFSVEEEIIHDVDFKNERMGGSESGVVVTAEDVDSIPHTLELQPL